MYEAFLLTDSKSTSPTNLPSSVLFIPTSITTAPSFTIVSFIYLGFPRAATRISALFVIWCIFFVLEWHIVTVAFFANKHCASGFPTILLLPTTTAFFPSISIPYSSNIFITPKGVHDIKQSSPITNLPTFTGLNPSTSFL